MTARKKPEGEALTEWCRKWDFYDHEHKLYLCADWGITYDTGKHWRSESAGVSGVPLFSLLQPTERDSISTPLHISITDGVKTLAVIGDTHNPYQDDKAMDTMEQVLIDIQPDYLVYNGDLNDFYQSSAFAKEPSRIGDFEKDLKSTKDMFKRHAEILPGISRILLEGTHEDRWTKYLQKTSYPVASLQSASVAELYELDNNNIQHVPFEQGLLINDVFLILHGDMARAHSSYTAKAMFEKHGGCGMCNHTHRGGSYYKKDRFGIYGWWENFCLCSLNPDWIQNPNWMHGFSLVHFSSTNRFWVEQLPIIGGKLMRGGQVYG